MESVSESPDQSEKKSSFKKSKVIFCIVMTLISLMIIWPGYTLFSSAKPLIFGFPISFAWIIFCTIGGFAALLFLYISDNKQEKAQ